MKIIAYIFLIGFIIYSINTTHIPEDPWHAIATVIALLAAICFVWYVGSSFIEENSDNKTKENEEKKVQSK